MQDGKETTSYMNVPHDVKLELPNGFRISDANEVASFTTLWYDELNKIGILEPVGTIPKYRKIGLGKAVIYEAIKRVKDKGVERIFSMGFSLAYSKEIWKKRISLFNAD
ncbi:GNAT family N-acetyltransferase [Paenibacillus sp. Mc5Re-14]|uniref:GNAT family N-acetyltransferase n=1 Tax=Paenibacillus sp. Mc5Re-14 TaxID=1030529 RepID=UPI0011464333|nr:GNAT family N-acetyltransferase [Paenibacillus sp. Mc5Re-14]